MKEWCFITAVTVFSLIVPAVEAAGDDKSRDWYTPVMYKNNYVWSAAMQLAWNELRDSILHGAVKLRPVDTKIQSLVDRFNNTPFSKDDCDPESYYIFSGSGMESIDRINREVRLKFPDKQLPAITIQLNPSDFIAYAYFNKKTGYPVPFAEKTVEFLNKKVRGFFVETHDQRQQVGVLLYTNDRRFILKIQLTDSGDELFVAKGFSGSSPARAVSEIERYGAGTVAPIQESERFEMPNLHLKVDREYAEIIGKKVANKGFEGYAIGAMKEWILFDLDHKGARVENQAVIAMPSAMPPDEEGTHKIRNFLLNEPFWVIMKRADSPRPYFIVGANTVDVMGRE